MLKTTLIATVSTLQRNRGSY